MRALFDLFFDICLLRRGPQDVPSAPALLLLCVLIYLGAGYLALLAGVGAAEPGRSLLLALLDLLLLSSMTYSILRALNHSARFTQTLTALTGCGALLQLIALPLGIWFDHANDSGNIAEIPLIFSLALLAWSVVVTAHILRHAFSVAFSAGVAYAFAYVFISWSLADWLLPLRP